MPAPARPDHENDGRVRRGLDNRRRIVAAVIELVREGIIAPTAEQVAARADVGLRTVFRHFDDMESLYREIAAAIEATILPIVERPFRSKEWRGRLGEIVDRRAELYEAIRPFKTATDVLRHQSAVLSAKQDEFARRQHRALVAALPAPLRARGDVVAALDLALSPEAWLRLRREQGLSPARAKRAILTIVEALTGGTT